jgi:hypothetical protein
LQLGAEKRKIRYYYCATSRSGRGKVRICCGRRRSQRYRRVRFVHGNMDVLTLFFTGKIGLISGFDNVSIVFVKRKGESGGSKHAGPFIGVKIGELFGRRHNCCKPIIKYDIELWSDGTGERIEGNGDECGMGW